MVLLVQMITLRTPHSMKKTANLIKDTLSHWQSKRASRMGAAISFYAVFSIAPFFILLINLVSAIFDRPTVIDTVHRTLQSAVGINLANIIQLLITSVQYPSAGGTLTTVVSLVVVIIGAVGMFSELNNDLDELWYVTPKQKRELTTLQTIVRYIEEQFSVFFLILLCGLMLLFSVAFTVFLSLTQKSIPVFEYIIHTAWLLSTLNVFLTILFSTIVFALVYRILPDTKLPWRELLLGALITAILFLIGKFLISWYITNFGKTNTFGTAGSFVALLLWIYYSAQVFFIGASYTFVKSKAGGYLSRSNQ